MHHRIPYQISRFHSSLASSSERSNIWDIFASVALMRPPIIAPPMNDIEKRYSDFMSQSELEGSLRCDFELRQLRDERYFFVTVYLISFFEVFDVLCFSLFIASFFIIIL